MMLSDAIRQTRERIHSGAIPADIGGMLLTLRAYEIEARNMEDRIELLTGRPHVPLDGRLIAAPGREVRHGA